MAGLQGIGSGESLEEEGELLLIEMLMEERTGMVGPCQCMLLDYRSLL